MLELHDQARIGTMVLRTSCHACMCGRRPARPLHDAIGCIITTCTAASPSTGPELEINEPPTTAAFTCSVAQASYQKGTRTQRRSLCRRGPESSSARKWPGQPIQRAVVPRRIGRRRWPGRGPAGFRMEEQSGARVAQVNECEQPNLVACASVVILDIILAGPSSPWP